MSFLKAKSYRFVEKKQIHLFMQINNNCRRRRGRDEKIEWRPWIKWKRGKTTEWERSDTELAFSLCKQQHNQRKNWMYIVHIIFWWENLVNLVKKKTQIYNNNKILKKSEKKKVFFLFSFELRFFCCFMQRVVKLIEMKCNCFIKKWWNGKGNVEMSANDLENTLID